MKIVLTLTGPSCSGKSTLERRLVDSGYARIISHTTRTPRPGEENGKDYYFVSREIFLQAEVAGEFVEVVEFGGNLYGGSVYEFDDKLGKGIPVVVVCEPNGREQIKRFGRENGWTVIPIYIGSPGETLAKRMVTRLADELWEADLKNIEPVLKRFKNRLATALTDEVEWRREARDQDDVYDLLFFQFDETTDEQVLSVIQETVDTLQAGQPVTRDLFHFFKEEA